MRASVHERWTRFLLVTASALALLLGAGLPMVGSNLKGGIHRLDLPPTSQTRVPAVAQSDCLPERSTPPCPVPSSSPTAHRAGPSPSLPSVTYPPWVTLSPATHPPPLSGAAMVYDAADGYDLLFGGGTGAIWGAYTYHGVNYTWRFDASRDVWSNLSLGHAPPASDQWAMAYDPVDGYVVAFGGGTNQTWTFSHGQWSQITPAHSPSARSTPCMVYDSRDGYVVMFGGATNGPGAIDANDTWSFSHGDWVNRSSGSAPIGSTGCGLTDDPSTGSVVLFGGWGPSSSGYATQNQTWTYAAGQWTHRTPSNVPNSRWGPLLTFVPSCGCDVLFGGFYFYSSGEDVRADTWVFEHGNWFSVSTNPTPGARGTAPFFWDPTVHRAVVYGGWNYNGLDSDTWTFGSLLNLTLTNSSLTSLDVGQTTALDVVVRGGSAPVSYNWTGLPAGCAASVTASVTCTVPSPTLANVSVTATDGNHMQAVLGFRMNVSAALNLAVTASPAVTDVGQPITLTAQVSGGGGGNRFGWQGVGSELGCNPPSSTADSSTVNCTPVSNAYYEVTVWANDRNGFNTSAPLLIVPVAAELNVSRLAADPSPVAVQGTLTIQVTFVGGTAPFSIAYTGLPPGCLSVNRSLLHCQPSATGTFQLGVTVRDAANVAKSASAALVVQPAAGGPSLNSLTTVEIAGAGVAAAVVVAAVSVVLWKRRRPRSP